MTDPEPDAGQSPDPVESTDADATATDREQTATTTAMPDQQSPPDQQDSASTSPADPDPKALFDEDAPAEASSGTARDDGLLPTAEDGTIQKVYWVGLAVSIVFGAVALLRFYASVSAAIDVWVAAEYRPLLQAAFNLAVVLAAGLTASLLLRQLSGSRS